MLRFGHNPNAGTRGRGLAARERVCWWLMSGGHIRLKGKTLICRLLFAAEREKEDLEEPGIYHRNERVSFQSDDARLPASLPAFCVHAPVAQSPCFAAPSTLPTSVLCLAAVLAVTSSTSHGTTAAAGDHLPQPQPAHA